MTESHEEFSIELDASADEVWRMLTTGDGLAAWFGTRASVDLRPDGEVVVGWGDAEEIVSRIRVADPPHRLRLVHLLEGREVGAEEWLVASSGTTTRLTLVHSLPDDDVDDWEGFYGDVRRGWRLFLASLRHALGAAHQPLRTVACRVHPLPGERLGHWRHVEALLGPIAGTGDRTAPGRGGHPVLADLEVAVAEPPAGVLLVHPARTLLVDLEGHGDHQVLYTQAAVHGGDPAWIDAALDLAGTIARPDEPPG